MEVHFQENLLVFQVNMHKPKARYRITFCLHKTDYIEI